MKLLKQIKGYYRDSSVMKNSVSYFLMNCYSSQESSNISRYILARFWTYVLDLPKVLTQKHRIFNSSPALDGVSPCFVSGQITQ